MLWLLVLCAFASAKPFDVSQMDSMVAIGPLVEIMVDQTDSLSAASVLALDSSKFYHDPRTIPTLSYTSHPVWARITLRSQKNEELYFEMNSSLIDEIRMYELEFDGTFRCQLAGLRHPANERSFLHWNYVFPVHLQKNVQHVFLFQLHDPDHMILPLRLWANDAFYRYNHSRMVSVGFFYGLLFGVSLLVLLSFMTFRDSNYLYYLYTILSFFLFLSANNGVAARFMVPNSWVPLMESISVIAIQLVLISLLEFTRKYIDTRKNAPFDDLILRSASLLVAISIVFGLILSPLLVNSSTPIIGMIVMLIVVVTTIRSVGTNRQATYYALGMSGPVCVGLAYAFETIGSFSSRHVSIDAFYWSFLFMVIFIGVGLGVRLRVLQQEKIVLQKQAVDNLCKADQLKDEFLANTTHELKTPLNGIIGIAEGLLGDRKKPLPVKVVRSLRLIVNCGYRLSNLINDILDYSRLKNGEIKLELKPVSVRRTTGIVFSILSPLAKKKGIELRNSVDVMFPNVRADENRLEQILLNLVGNAIKFTESGFVDVSAKVLGEMAIISIQDSGIGIPAEDHANIFEMFQQVDASIARIHGGTGIGLSLSRRLVTLQGGTIWVESSLGHGACFMFTLPITAAHGSLQDEHSDGNELLVTEDVVFEFMANKDINKGACNIPRILVVDDEPVNLQVLVNQLGLEGFDLWVATHGQEALDMLELHGAPDLVLLDLMMPGISGLDLCQEIRRRYDASLLPIIMLTAKNQMKELVKSLDIGANDFLPKPFTKVELLARIRVHLNLANLHKAYSRFVPREFLEQMQRDNISQVQLGDQWEQYLAVVVTDIRNFTSRAEHGTPSETFRFLNSYLEQMAPLIRKNGGFVSKFLGDSIIALFPDGARQALDASTDMLLALDNFNQEEFKAGHDATQIGIGIHVGKAILGTVGFQTRMDVTVISQKIGQATLFERLTKVFGAEIIVSDDVLRLSKESNTQSRLLGRIPQPGKERWLEFHEVFGAQKSGEVSRKLSTRSLFERGVKLFWEEDKEQALVCFEQVLLSDPQDQAANAYLRECNATSESSLLHEVGWLG